MIEFGSKVVVTETIFGNDRISVGAHQTLYISLLGNNLAAFSYKYDAIKQSVPSSNKILAVTGQIILLRSKLLDVAREVSNAV
jgi:hypothetical protein